MNFYTSLLLFLRLIIEFLISIFIIFGLIVNLIIIIPIGLILFYAPSIIYCNYISTCKILLNYKLINYTLVSFGIYIIFFLLGIFIFTVLCSIAFSVFEILNYICSYFSDFEEVDLDLEVDVDLEVNGIFSENIL